MDKKNKNPNVPNLRFPGFYNEWEKICIESLITEEKIYTSDFEKYPLYSFTIELGIIPKTERYERGFLIKKDGNLFKVVQQNDFVMNPMNLRFGAINYSKVSKSISVSGYYNIFRMDNCKFNDFWNAYFKTPKLLNLYNSIATGSLVEKKRVHFSQFKKIKMYMPCELEKQKIDTLIKLLDLRIETQSKIINDLKFLKEGISNLIFKIPVIENSNKTLQNFLIEGDKTPVDTKKYRKITIKLNKQGIVYSDLTREMADTRPFYLRHKGELIIGKQNYFNGSIAIVDSQFDSCICSNAIMSFKVKNIDKNFLYYQISNNNYLNSQSYKANGTGQKELSEKEFLKFKVWCPSNELQKLIVCSIKGVDEKMNNEIIILKKYIEQKEYLLNNLFI